MRRLSLEVTPPMESSYLSGPGSYRSGLASAKHSWLTGINQT
jgi:hypothetical protein